MKRDRGKVKLRYVSKKNFLQKEKQTDIVRYARSTKYSETRQKLQNKKRGLGTKSSGAFHATDHRKSHNECILYFFYTYGIDELARFHCSASVDL
jgi:hypothetical protein